MSSDERAFIRGRGTAAVVLALGLLSTAALAWAWRTQRVPPTPERSPEPKAPAPEPSEVDPPAAAVRVQLRLLGLGLTGNHSIPPELADLERELRDPTFERYASVRLLETQSVELAPGRSVVQSFDEPIDAELELLVVDADRLELSARVLREGVEALSTRFEIARGQSLLIPLRVGEDVRVLVLGLDDRSSGSASSPLR